MELLGKEAPPQHKEEPLQHKEVLVEDHVIGTTSREIAASVEVGLNPYLILFLSFFCCCLAKSLFCSWY